MAETLNNYVSLGLGSTVTLSCTCQGKADSNCDLKWYESDVGAEITGAAIAGGTWASKTVSFVVCKVIK